MIRKMGGWLTSDESFFEVEADAEEYEARYQFNEYYIDGFLGKRSLDGVGSERMMDWLEEHFIGVRKYLDAVEVEQ